VVLKKLTEASGIPGQEKEVRDILKAEIDGLVDRYWVDPLGNLLAVRGDRGPRVMLAAHMDEVGLIVTHIDQKGGLRFSKVGGIEDQVLVSKRVLVGKDRLPGVIGAKPVHLQNHGEREHPIRSEDMYVDIGAKSREEAEKLAPPGTAMVFDTCYEALDERIVKAKALDDRAGCAALLEVLKEEYDLTLCVAFTVQEELGLRGAGVAAYALMPDMAVVLEGTTCADTPGAEENEWSSQLGKGAVLSYMDRASVSNRRMIEEMTRLGREQGIHYQFKRTTAGGNDAGRIHLTREGVATASVSIPCRYIHSPVSVMSLDDSDSVVSLVKAFLKSVEGGFLPND